MSVTSKTDNTRPSTPSAARGGDESAFFAAVLEAQSAQSAKPSVQTPNPMAVQQRPSQPNVQQPDANNSPLAAGNFAPAQQSGAGGFGTNAFPSAPQNFAANPAGGFGANAFPSAPQNFPANRAGGFGANAFAPAQPSVAASPAGGFGTNPLPSALQNFTANPGGGFGANAFAPAQPSVTANPAGGFGANAFPSAPQNFTANPGGGFGANAFAPAQPSVAANPAGGFGANALPSALQNFAANPAGGFGATAFPSALQNFAANPAGGFGATAFPSALQNFAANPAGGFANVFPSVQQFSLSNSVPGLPAVFGIFTQNFEVAFDYSAMFWQGAEQYISGNSGAFSFKQLVTLSFYAAMAVPQALNVYNLALDAILIPEGENSDKNEKEMEERKRASIGNDRSRDDKAGQ